MAASVGSEVPVDVSSSSISSKTAWISASGALARMRLMNFFAELACGVTVKH